MPKFGDFDTLEELIADNKAKSEKVGTLEKSVESLTEKVGEIDGLKGKIAELSKKPAQKKTGQTAQEKLDAFDTKFDPSDLNGEEMRTYNTARFKLLRAVEKEEEQSRTDRKNADEKVIQDKHTAKFIEQSWEMVEREYQEEHGKPMPKKERAKLEKYCKDNSLLATEGVLKMALDDAKSKSKTDEDEAKKKKEKEEADKKEQERKDRVHTSPEGEAKDEGKVIFSGRDGRAKIASEIASNEKLNALFDDIGKE
jgi:hypothetical protein